MTIRYQLAGIEELEQVTELRVDVLQAVNQLPKEYDMTAIRQATRAYYQQAFGGKQQATCLAFVEEELAGIGSICFYQVLPTCSNPSGKKAYIMNMYTRPAFRRQGIAKGILNQLIATAYNQGVHYITLEATEAGRKLYQSCGFQSVDTEMILPRPVST